MAKLKILEIKLGLRKIGDWSEDWWSDELVAAVYASDTWDDDWWWSAWDEGLSDAWTDASKAKATSKAPAKASGLALAAVTLGSMFAGTSSCLVPSPCHEVSLGCMLEGCVDFDDFSASVTCGDSSLHLPSWETCLLLCITCHIKTNLEMEQTCCILRLGGLGTWEAGHKVL